MARKNLGPAAMVSLNNREKKALEIHERHEVIREFLMVVLNVDEETADHDACHIEHVVSPVTFEGIKKLLRDTKEAKAE